MTIHALRTQLYSDIFVLTAAALAIVVPTRVAGNSAAHTESTASPIVREQALPMSRLPSIPERYQVMSTMTLTVTAYSSTVDQTDSDPFTTASGAKVCDGTIAYNYLPFGTKVRFPDQFGDKVFIVTDRMPPHKGKYIADIWMSTREEAIQWGAPVVRMEVLALAS